MFLQEFKKLVDERKCASSQPNQELRCNERNGGWETLNLTRNILYILFKLFKQTILNLDRKKLKKNIEEKNNFGN